MPAKRRQPKKRAHAISPEAVAAFRRRDSAGLRRALGLKPWEADPLDVEPSDREMSSGSIWRESVEQSLQLRTELEAASLTVTADRADTVDCGSITADSTTRKADIG